METKEIEELVKQLQKSPLFNFSMSNKEFFHSNVLAWLGNNFKDEFRNLINDLLGPGSWPNDLKDFTVEREYNHFDICIKGSLGPRIIIENKVKSIPTKRQLDGYKNKIKKGDCLFILLTMTSNLHNMTIAEGWKVVTYKNISDKLSKVTLSNPYYNQLLKDYCEYIKNLQDIIEKLDKEESYFSKKEIVKYNLGIHDLCGKRKVQMIYHKLLEGCEHKKWVIISDINSLTENNIFINWGYTNKPLIEIKMKSNNDNIVIQIEGNQYRHAVEFFDKDLGDRITKIIKDGKKKTIDYIPSRKGICYLSNNYSNILSLKDDRTPQNYPSFIKTVFGQKKEPGYCKYCNGRKITQETHKNFISCFVYQWIAIPEDITCDVLIEKIVEDIAKMKILIKNF